MQAAKARRLGAELGFPAMDAVDLREGEDRWRAYLANPKHPLEPLFAEIAGFAEKIKSIKVELYLRVENNSKFVRGKEKVRDEIERYILRQYAMEKHPNGVEYTLTILYETDEHLEQIIYREILQEAASTVNVRYCFIEADVRALDDSGRHWEKLWKVKHHDLRLPTSIFLSLDSDRKNVMTLRTRSSSATLSALTKQARPLCTCTAAIVSPTLRTQALSSRPAPLRCWPSG